MTRWPSSAPIPHCRMGSSEDNPQMNDKPPKKPYLHIRSVDGLLFPEAIAITGNASLSSGPRSTVR